MNSVVKCPSRDELERLLQGQLPLADVEHLARHLESCNRCAQTVAALPVDDTLVEALRKQSEAQHNPLEPVFANLTERSRAMRPAIGSTSETITPETSVDAKAGQPAENAASPAERFDFLAPPQQPDEIGRLGSYRMLKVLARGGKGGMNGTRARNPAYRKS